MSIAIDSVQVESCLVQVVCNFSHIETGVTVFSSLLSTSHFSVQTFFNKSCVLHVNCRIQKNVDSESKNSFQWIFMHYVSML